MAEKLNLKKHHKELYRASAKEPRLVEVPPLQYLMVDGAGDPNTAAAYGRSLEALYGLAYTLKFQVKKAPGGTDFGVMSSESLWWAEDPEDFARGNKDNWLWTNMIPQPDFITAEQVEAARAAAMQKKENELLTKVRLADYTEGLSAQIMHVGPYADEGPTIAKLHCFMADKGYTFGGKHHEIYLNDPRRTAPERLKTIIRQPVTKA